MLFLCTNTHTHPVPHTRSHTSLVYRSYLSESVSLSTLYPLCSSKFRLLIITLNARMHGRVRDGNEDDDNIQQQDCGSIRVPMVEEHGSAAPFCAWSFWGWMIVFLLSRVFFTKTALLLGLRKSLLLHRVALRWHVLHTCRTLVLLDFPKSTTIAGEGFSFSIVVIVFLLDFPVVCSTIIGFGEWMVTGLRRELLRVYSVRVVGRKIWFNTSRVSFGWDCLHH